MAISLYHASPVRIEQFDFSDGVHFGSYYSALEAALRKTDKTIYVHRIKFLERCNIFESEDVGSKEEWNKVIDDAIDCNCTVIKYINKYEPGSSQSYIFLDDKRIVYSGIVTISAQDAEQALLDYGYSTYL
jgi:hypothetical protein